MKQREFKNRIVTLVQLPTIPCVFLLSDVTLNILAGNQISYMWFSPGHRVLSLSAPCLRLVQLLSTGPDLIVLIGGTKVQFAEQVVDTPAEQEQSTHLNWHLAIHHRSTWQFATSPATNLVPIFHLL